MATAGLTYGQTGTIDFIQYWSGFHLLLSGQNPYDSFALHDLQASQGQDPNQVIMLWNPPWVLTLLAPVLWLPFETSALLWLLLFPCILLFLVTLNEPRGLPFIHKWLTRLVGMTFLPLYDGAHYGQASALVAVGTATFLFAAKKESYVWAGLALVLCSIKPHLFLVAAPFLLMWIIVNRHWKILLGFGGGIALTVIPLLALRPTILFDWIGAFSSVHHPSVIPVTQWRTASLGNVLRGLITNDAQELTWLIWAPTAIGLAIASYVSIVLRNVPIKCGGILPLLSASWILSPYGWLYDQSMLLPSILRWIRVELLQKGAFLVLGAYLVCHILVMVQTLGSIKEQSQFFWFPGVVLVLSLLTFATSSHSK